MHIYKTVDFDFNIDVKNGNTLGVRIGASDDDLNRVIDMNSNTNVNMNHQFRRSCGSSSANGNYSNDGYEKGGKSNNSK